MKCCSIIGFSITIAIVGLVVLSTGCRDKPVAGKPKLKSITILTKTYPMWYSIDKKAEIENKDTLYLKEYEEYDSLGNNVVKKVRGGDVLLDTYYKNKYNSSGILIGRIESSFPDFPLDRCSVDTFIYNSKKQLTRFGSPSDTIMIAYEYNEQGQKISEYSTASSGYLIRYEYVGDKIVKEADDFYKKIFVYNDKDQLVKEILFFDSPDTINLDSYIYNDLGQVAQITKYHYESKTTSVDRITYNSEGQIIEKIQDDVRYIYIYDYFR